MITNSHPLTFEQHLFSTKLTKEQAVLMLEWYKQLPSALQTDLLSLITTDPSALQTLARFFERKQSALHLNDKVAWEKVIQAEMDWLSKIA